MNKIGNIFSVVVVIVAALLLYGFYAGSELVIYALVAINLVSGPLCLILYLREVKRGVFAAEEGNELQ